MTRLSSKTSIAHHKLAIHNDATAQAGSDRCCHRRELRIASELHAMAVKCRRIPIVGIHGGQTNDFLEGFADWEPCPLAVAKVC